jgi:hypothetical protein
MAGLRVVIGLEAVQPGCDKPEAAVTCGIPEEAYCSRTLSIQLLFPARKPLRSVTRNHGVTGLGEP